MHIFWNSHHFQAIRRFGGFGRISQESGLKSKRCRPRGYWRDIDNVVCEIKAFMAEAAEARQADLIASRSLGVSSPIDDRGIVALGGVRTNADAGPLLMETSLRSRNKKQHHTDESDMSGKSEKGASVLAPPPRPTEVLTCAED